MNNDPRKTRYAVKMSDEEFERFYAEIYKEFGPQADKNSDLLRDVPVRRIPSVYDEAPAEGTVKHVDHKAAAKRRAGGLVAIICVELLGIAGVAVWWILRLL